MILAARFGHLRGLKAPRDYRAAETMEWDKSSDDTRVMMDAYGDKCFSSREIKNGVAGRVPYPLHWHEAMPATCNRR